MRHLRGDISAPVLAILVTVGVIIAGLTLLGWFWYISQQAGRVGMLQVLGTPALLPNEPGENTSNYTLFILVRNLGTDPVVIMRIVVEDTTCTIINGNNVVSPGDPEEIVASCEFTINMRNKKTIRGTLFTDYGTYPFIATTL